MDAMSAALGDLGVLYLSLPLFPVFEMVHYAKVALIARSESGSKEFATKYPLSSCLSTILLGCGGTIFTNLILGRPIGEIFLNPFRLMLASLVWYAVFFSPFDVVYSTLMTTPLKVFVVVMKDIRRLRQVLVGMQLALAAYPGAWLLAVIAATLKSSGTNLMVTFDRFVRGDSSICNHELLKPKYPTKFSFLTACLLVAQEMEYIPMSQNLLLVLLVTVLIAGSLTSLLLGYRDPFSIAGSMMCPVLFGTVSDGARINKEVEKPKQKDE